MTVSADEAIERLDHEGFVILERLLDREGVRSVVEAAEAPAGDVGAVPAIMPAGSVLLFDGGLLHRGGANRSPRTRLAVSPQYCQPWLRPQESQLLIVPPAAAARCSPRARSMLGYSIHPPFIGQVDGMHPLRLVDPNYRSEGRAKPTEASLIADRMLVPEPA